ncbi:hypothetical protein NKG05_08420 [Oerskovia sp. M15]
MTRGARSPTRGRPACPHPLAREGTRVSPDQLARHVLFPGRHHLVTRFQVDYLRALRAPGPRPRRPPCPVCSGRGGRLGRDVREPRGHAPQPGPGHRREALIEHVTAVEHLPSVVVPIPDVARTRASRTSSRRRSRQRPATPSRSILGTRSSPAPPGGHRGVPHPRVSGRGRRARRDRRPGRGARPPVGRRRAPCRG